MDIIDISVPVSPAHAVWHNAPKTEVSWHRRMNRGDISNNSNLFMNCHSGTHIDAPLHFVAGGDAVEKISLEILVGRATVVEIADPEVVTVAELEEKWPGQTVTRVLFKTKNSAVWKNSADRFVENFCALTEESARWLLDKKVKLIGIDYLSIQKFKTSPITHQLLLSAPVVILEGLDLSQALSGDYELICLPLKLIGNEAAPARAILRRIEKC